jgi:predicted dehydrogenase
MDSKVKVGVVGCGKISGAYFGMCPKLEDLEVVACADLMMDRAREAAEKFGIPKACTTDELLADLEIEIVINLTIPAVHEEVALKAIEAGKSVYNEKPLALNRDQGLRILEAAAARGVRVGCAPDTFLGGGGQTCRHLIDEGAIGRPVAAVAFMLGSGHETWHPDPEFYYKPGGGPMFDMGPYYLTALVNLMGPVRRVTGATSISFPERTITSQPKHGQVITVEVPTHVTGLMDFQNGAVGTIITSFDIKASQLPRIQVYGTEGSISVPDPNQFGGTIGLWRSRENGWEEVPAEGAYVENSRSLGVADMAAAIRAGRPHRASGELAFHVLDLMQAFHDASDTGRHVELTSHCERPAPLPLDLPYGRVDG